MAPESSSFPTAWRTVSFGTVCLSAGAIAVLLGVLALSAVIAFNTNLASQPSLEGLESPAQRAPMLSVIGCLLVLFTGGMFWLAGLCMMCTVPAETGARPLAWGASACWLLFLVMMLQVPLSSVGIRLPGPRLGNEQRGQQRGVVCVQRAGVHRPGRGEPAGALRARCSR